MSLILLTITDALVKGLPFVQIAQAVGSAAVGISAIVALSLYLVTVKRHQSEDARKASYEYLKEAKNILERAYEIFTDDGRNTTPPRNDRVTWLNTARMFLRYYRIKDKLNQEDHKEIVKQHEEYWRVQFYNLLRRNTPQFDLSYFRCGGGQYNPETIHRDSIGVIFDFARWYDDTEDPLKDADVITMFAKGALPLDQEGAHQYIESFEDYFQKIQSRKTELQNHDHQQKSAGEAQHTQSNFIARIKKSLMAYFDEER